MGGPAYLCTRPGAADGTLHKWVNVFFFRHQLKHLTLMDPVCLWINIFSKLSISRMKSSSYKRIIMPLSISMEICDMKIFRMLKILN